MQEDYNVLAGRVVDWIREWFEKNGAGCCAVVGMSGGKDSTVVAALCVAALGADRVVGVAMPADGQGINEADEICSYLGIKYLCVPIGNIIASFSALEGPLGRKLSVQSEQNIPPRVRMSVLYAVSQTLDGRVANTCNLSENWVGYATRWGDSVGDFSPTGELLVKDIKGIGHALGIPSRWVDKVPDDGLPHSCSDEEKFGFTYAMLDEYIETGHCPDEAVKSKIDSMHARNWFKVSMPESFKK